MKASTIRIRMASTVGRGDEGGPRPIHEVWPRIHEVWPRTVLVRPRADGTGGVRPRVEGVTGLEGGAADGRDRL
ncbi:hypothetical protein ALMP_81880 [Streptomyces sp. A012304]|nr:hypothetical protein ALMP_81880 [Streptomyces sp. A012304]